MWTTYLLELCGINDLLTINEVILNELEVLEIYVASAYIYSVQIEVPFWWPNKFVGLLFTFDVEIEESYRKAPGYKYVDIGTLDAPYRVACG